MTAFFSRLRAIVARIFAAWRPAQSAQPIAAAPPTTDPSPFDSAPPKRERAGDGSGGHYYLDTLLDDLGYYFDVLPHLRVHDPDTYALYRRIGAMVMPSKSSFIEMKGLHPFFRERGPAFGMLHFGKPEEEDRDAILITFAYFQRFDRRAYVQLTNAVLYEVTLYYRDPRPPHGARSVRYYVGMTGDKIEVLRQLQSHAQPMGRGPYRAVVGADAPYRFSTAHHQRWGIGRQLIDIYEDHRARGGTAKSPSHYALDIFRMVANASVLAGSGGLQVMCERDGTCARFTIDMLRTPYFFRDRQKTVTARGRTRRIFHIVRAHQRSDGRMVKSHFRGLQQFSWNGYNVSISMPGLHHAMLESANFGAVDFPDDDPAPPGYIDMAKTGDVLQEAMRLKPAQRQASAS